MVDKLVVPDATMVPGVTADRLAIPGTMVDENCKISPTTTTKRKHSTVYSITDTAVSDSVNYIVNGTSQMAICITIYQKNKTQTTLSLKDILMH